MPLFKPPVSIPIGGIVAWLQDFTGTPALPKTYTICDGHAISDPDSPYNGKNTPDLKYLYLMGGAVSGNSGGANTHVHTSGTLVNGRNLTTVVATPGLTSVAADGHIHNITGNTGSAASLPPYYSVVWVMRIK